MKDKKIEEILKIVKKIHKGKKGKKGKKKNRGKKTKTQPAFRPYPTGGALQSYAAPQAFAAPRPLIIPANGLPYNTIQKQALERGYNSDIMAQKTAYDVHFLKNFVKNLYRTPPKPERNIAFRIRPEDDFTRSIHAQETKEREKIEEDFSKLAEQQAQQQPESLAEEQVIEPTEAETSYDEDTLAGYDTEYGAGYETEVGEDEPMVQDVPEPKSKKGKKKKKLVVVDRFNK